MRYHDIRSFDMLNGDGIRVVLFVSGCNHHCKGCQNPETWSPDSGIEFDDSAMRELLEGLSKDYISGLTLSGGDPLFYGNLEKIEEIIKDVKKRFPEKTIWLYTGYRYDEIFPKEKEVSDEMKKRQKIVNMCDVIVDGKFEEDKKDSAYPWAGSTNQRVIEVKHGLR